MSATLDAANVTRLTLTVPAHGAWVAECATDAAPPALGARCTLTVLGVPYRGTCVHRGEYAGQGGARIVGGAGAWGNTLPAKGYHSDSGVSARTVVNDLFRATGETLGTWTDPGPLGVDWARPTGEASRSLTEALSPVPWYVSPDGVTHCAERPTGTMAANVLDWDPVQSLVILGPETSLAGVAPGLTITDPRLPGPLVAREIRVELSGSQVRVIAWCPAESSGRGRIATALAEIVGAAQPLRLWGKYRYRVFRMSGDRVECQVVSKSSGLPDLVPLSMWPGAPGVHAELTMGSEVLVEFVEGDPGQPIVTHFAPKGSGGWVPVTLSLADGTNPVARVGDSVMVPLAGATFSAIIAPATSPVAVAITVASPLLGVIGTGNPKVLA